MDNLDYDPYPTIGEEELPNPQPGRAWIRGIRDYSTILHQINTATLIIIYGPILALAQLKFQNQEKSPFETNHFFMILSVVSICIAATTSGLLFYIHHRLQNSTVYNFPLAHYIVLRGVSIFFGILTPGSVILVLIVPDNLNWVRYFIICVLLGVVVICSFRGYLKLYEMEDEVNMEAHKMV